MKHIKLALLTLILTLTSNAYANLQVFPTRILLTEKKRSDQIVLRHVGTKPAKYRISVIFYKQNPDGSMTPEAKPKDQDRFGGKYFNFSPRRVELQPNVEQIVRIISKKPASLPEGEYRAHIHFEEEESSVLQNNTATNEVKMNLKPRLAIAVPIVIRQGEPKLNVTLKDLKITTLANNQKAFSVNILNDAPANVYGDFRAFQISKDGKETLIGEVNGVSSYIAKRSAVYTLSEEKNYTPEKGTKVRLELRKSVEEGGDVLTSTETTLQ